MNTQSDGETQQATQFEGGSDDSQLWEAKKILDERTRTVRGKSVGEYLVDWMGTDSETGKPWDPTWQKKTDCTNDLIQEWKKKKQDDPEIVGRWQREEAERKKEAKAAAASKRKSARNSSRAGSVASSRTGKRKRSEGPDDVSGDVGTSARKKSGLSNVENGSTVDLDSENGIASPSKPTTSKRRVLGRRDDSLISMYSNKSPSHSPARSTAPTTKPSTPGPSSRRKAAQTADVVTEPRPDSSDEEQIPLSMRSRRPPGKGKQPVRQDEPVPSSPAGRERDSGRGQTKVYGNSAVRPRQTTGPSLLEQIFGGDTTGDDEPAGEEVDGEDPTDPVEDAEATGDGNTAQLPATTDSVIVIDASPASADGEAARNSPERAVTPEENGLDKASPTRSKHVTFAETQESHDSVVPGTISTVEPSQPSQESEASQTAPPSADASTVAEEASSVAKEASPSGSEDSPVTDKAPPVLEGTRAGPRDASPSQEAPTARQESSSLETSAENNNAANGSASSDEGPARAETAVMKAAEDTVNPEESQVTQELENESQPSPHGGLDVQMFEAADVSIDSSLDADLSPSQTDAFKAAVAMMVQRGYEEVEDASQGQMTASIEVAGEEISTALPSVTTLAEDVHATNRDLTPAPLPRAERLDPIQAAWNPRRSSTPERSAMRPLAHLSAPVPRKTTSSTIVQELTFTQESIEQFSSPIRSPAPVREKVQRGTLRPVEHSDDVADPFGADGITPNFPGLPTASNSMGPVTPAVPSKAPTASLTADTADKHTHPPTAPAPRQSQPPQSAAARGISSRDLDPTGAIPEQAARIPLLDEALSAARRDVEAFRTISDTKTKEILQITNERDAQAVVIGRLERENAGLEEKRVKADSTIDGLRVSLASVGEDLQLHQGLYSQASNRAVELARENTTLEEQVTLLKGQLDLGLKQQKLHAQAEISRLDEENTNLKHKLAFLLQQNRSTGDAIRHRAAQYPNLQREHYKLAETVAEERRKAGHTQIELKQAKKEISRLARQLDLCRPADTSEDDSPAEDEDLEGYPRTSDLLAKGFTLPESAGKGAGNDRTVNLPVTQPVASSSRPTDQGAASAPNAPPPAAVVSESNRPVSEEASRPTMSLLEYLRQSFFHSSLPFSVRIDVMGSQSKRMSNTASLFPYSHEQHKIWESRVLITVTGQAEQVDGTTAPLMASALEAYIYTIPATLSTVIYISKVDSSGYSALGPGLKVPALTNLLVTSFLAYYIAPHTRPTPRVYCRLFARAQKQYLFANSSNGGAKKVLSGLGLCKWWRSVFENAVLKAKAPSITLGLNCWLPGVTPTEAKNQLGPSQFPGTGPLSWSYAPPFGESETTPLYPDRANTAARKLACLIPRFEDDPKGRYLDELVINASSKAQAALRREAMTNPNNNSSEITAKAVQQRRKEDEAKLRREAALSIDKFKPAEFWETLSARQDCYPGDQTGFLGLSVCPLLPSPIEPEQVKRIEARLDNSTGLNSKIVGRLVTALLNHDFGSITYALTASNRFVSEMERILSAEIGEEAWQKQCVVEVAKNVEARATPAVTSNSSQAAGRSVNVLQAVRKGPRKTPQSLSTLRKIAPGNPSRADGPPGQAYRCKWKLGDGIETQCSALFTSAAEFERHVKSHTA